MPEPGLRFSLRSLLAVVTICCVLLAIIWPAVQAAREAGRRTECGNNLRMIGITHHNFHETYKRLPPGMTGDDTNQYGWCVYIHPFIESSGLYGELMDAGMFLQRGGQNVDRNGKPDSAAAMFQQLHVDANLVSPPGVGAKRTTPPGNVIVKQKFWVYLCPSSNLPAFDNDSYGASHYCGNAGNAFADYGCAAFPGKLQNGLLLFANDNDWTEVVKFADVTDGLSQTILVGEVGVSEDVGPQRTNHGCFPIWAGGNNDGGCSPGTWAPACACATASSRLTAGPAQNPTSPSAATIPAAPKSRLPTVPCGSFRTTSIRRSGVVSALAMTVLPPSRTGSK